MADQIKITILDDGTIKVETDKVSGPNHLGAEAFLREISKLAGGKTEVKRKSPNFALNQTQPKHLTQ